MRAARDDVVAAVCGVLADAGDPDRAKGQQAYMKSAMPFRGISAPRLKAALAPLLSDPAYLLDGRQEWEATVRQLWERAQFREERYSALAICRHRLYRQWAQDPGAMPLYRHLVESGAWWDFVDEIAAHQVGPVLRSHTKTESNRMRSWAIADSMWLRRAAILSQLLSKDH